MHAYRVPGVNDLGKFGRRAFAEFTAVHGIEWRFAALIGRFTKNQATA
jgi:type III restriction enzyme